MGEEEAEETFPSLPRRSAGPRPRHLRFLGVSRPRPAACRDALQDLDERDVLWDLPDSPSSVDDYPRSPRRRVTAVTSGLSAALAGYQMSAPVDVPAWPPARADEGEEEGEWGEGMVLPHVVVGMRSRGAASATFSVFEGAGRTLKGRDLRTVRNAVLRKTGFLD